MLLDVATLVYLHIFYDCFHTIMAELSRCDRDHLAHRVENIYYLAKPALDAYYSPSG